MISELKEILEKEKKLKQEYEKLKQKNLIHYYMIDVEEKKKENSILHSTEGNLGTI